MGFGFCHVMKLDKVFCCQTLKLNYLHAIKVMIAIGQKIVVLAQSVHFVFL